MLDDVEVDILKVSILGTESIHCGIHLTPYIVQTVLTTLPASTYVLVTDTNVALHHLALFEAEFSVRLDHTKRFLHHVIRPGEMSKSREGKTEIEDFLLLNKCTRDTLILALGGGVIGDLVGFVAATFMRGVRYVQIPTTLLAMVDSSVGGKTAIDTPQGKNLIGAFWQPQYIFIDAAFLETLPIREFSNGMAEVVKTAAIWNEQEFASLESRSAEILVAIQIRSTNFSGRTKKTRSAAQDILLSVIVGSISVKAHIVTNDERETTGLRNLVNFGHSIGHAIEAILTPEILHGECVSIGMILEAELARQMGVLNQIGVGRLARCLKTYNLPVSLSDSRIASLPASRMISVERLLDIMRIDKKNSGNEKKIVILSGIGTTYEKKATSVPDDLIVKTLSDAVRVVAGIPKRNPVLMVTPGSKSISNRSLILASLGRGTCRFKNLLHSDDTQVMMTALMELKGAKFTWEDDGETLVVQGGEGLLTVPPNGHEIYLGNAGTAARFLTAVCTLAQGSHSETTIITGNARMKQRPIGPLVDALLSNGSQIQYLESQGCLPLSISPNGLKGSRIQLAASISSQYVSSILLCAPYAHEPVTLELTGGQVISQPYIDMTIATMKTFGIEVVRRTGPDTCALLDIYDIPKGIYTNPSEYRIESDASSATYPLAIAAITGTSCTIKNIGSASLQGDARFAKEVLEKMGCEVAQTPDETKVSGSPYGRLKAIAEIDMETMTDAFLTASVLAATANGKTRIIGIANQRVKECNRIQAMMDELGEFSLEPPIRQLSLNGKPAKFGVETNELDDGLEVTGKPLSELKQGVRVHCYDDHRVAMAFSVLGSVVAGTVLDEKRCVEKTWPNWWDDLENKIGIKVEGVDMKSENAPLTKVTTQCDPQASILLIGMRGSGKTFVGELAASSLGWSCIDADAHLEAKHKIGVRQFVHERGWSAFRDAEEVVLKELLSQRPTGHVISLGGGVVETPRARELLKSYANQGGPVVYVVRPIDEIVQYLGVETARPAYGEPIEVVFRRRLPWFKECSNYEFVNVTEERLTHIDAALRWKAVRDEVTRFFKHITGVHPNYAKNLESGGRSYFLSLTYPDITQAVSQMEQLTTGVDAVELRVDLLRPPSHIDTFSPFIPSTDFVSDQLAALRRATSLPIVFTVRTIAQGGSFPDAAEDKAFKLLDLAVRHGAEYLDVEISWTLAKTRTLAARKANSKIIASWHDWSGNMKWNGSMLKEKYDLANELGDVVKIVGKANSLQDNFELYEFVSRVRTAPNSKPIIAINMGVEGQMSRILNETFTPVSHLLLPTKAAPGQLSFTQIQQALHLIGQLPRHRFFLFGSPIQQSMSPMLHNTGFEVLQLPHVYELLQTATIDETVKATMTSPDFGGASVTIPLKLDVIPLLDKLSPAAETIGAVNTIIPRATEAGGSQKLLYGDNTDWLGIYNVVSLHQTPESIQSALVIGAGGTARAAIFALHKLGAKVIYLCNRTRSKAEVLKLTFSFANVEVIKDLRTETWPKDRVMPSVIVFTVPASSIVTTDGVDGGIYVPITVFGPMGGVVVDMAYRPVETSLLKMAKESAPAKWKIVAGLEVLLEQGYAQFELWTSRRCPRKEVSEKVWHAYLATV